MVAISIAEKPARGGSRMRWPKLGFMACVACVQLWTQGSLTSYAMALHQSAERHASLQAMLREAEESLRRLQNETKSCEVIQRDKAGAAAEAYQRETALKQRLDSVQDDNEWLNRTVVAKAEALRSETSARIQLEASVHSLKEQMSLMQGQLVTAQQQQGTLHKHKHH